MRLPTLAPLLAFLLLAGCASAHVDDPVNPAAISVLPGTETALSKTVRLRFDSIADSRCPANVRCVWAGVITYHFTLTAVAGSETFKLESGQVHDSATLKGVRIALSKASPGPAQGLGVKPPAHAVTLDITRF